MKAEMTALVKGGASKALIAAEKREYAGNKAAPAKSVTTRQAATQKGKAC
jgi:hypothetical protein